MQLSCHAREPVKWLVLVLPGTWRAALAPFSRGALSRLLKVGVPVATCLELSFAAMFEQIVIVGAGQAAVQAIDTLRRKGFTGKLALIGDEPWLPYQRPPLSKKYLAGALERDRVMLRPAHFYTDHAVETHLGRRSRKSPERTRDCGSMTVPSSLMTRCCWRRAAGHVS